VIITTLIVQKYVVKKGLQKKTNMKLAGNLQIYLVTAPYLGRIINFNPRKGNVNVTSVI
jgi:hypothetical protein